MAVKKALPPEKKEKLVPLKEIKPGSGQVFRMQGTTYAEAVSEKEEACFWMVIAAKPEKTGRVTVCSIDGKQVLERDDDHLVIAHNVDHYVAEAEMVDA